MRKSKYFRLLLAVFAVLLLFLTAGSASGQSNGKSASTLQVVSRSGDKTFGVLTYNDTTSRYEGIVAHDEWNFYFVDDANGIVYGCDDAYTRPNEEFNRSCLLVANREFGDNYSHWLDPELSPVKIKVDLKNMTWDVERNVTSDLAYAIPKRITWQSLWVGPSVTVEDDWVTVTVVFDGKPDEVQLCVGSDYVVSEESWGSYYQQTYPQIDEDGKCVVDIATELKTMQSIEGDGSTRIRKINIQNTQELSDGESKSAILKAIVATLKDGSQKLIDDITAEWATIVEDVPLTVASINLSKVSKETYYGDYLTGNIAVTYSNGTVVTVPISDVSTDFYRYSTGRQNVTVTYGDVSATMDVTVHGVTSIDISPLPDEIQVNSAIVGYFAATYDDGTTKNVNISNASINNFNSSKPGEQNITVYFDNASAQKKITVFNGNPSAGPEKDRYLVVRSQDMVDHEWDTQFWIYSPTKFVEGDKWEVCFDRKADHATNAISTQTHKDFPGGYIHWAAIGGVTFTEEWATYTNSGTFTSVQADGDYVAFNLNDFNPANNYYFDNISFKINGIEQITNGDFSSDNFSSFWIKEAPNGYTVQVSADNIIYDNTKPNAKVVALDFSKTPKDVLFNESLAGTFQVVYNDGSSWDTDIACAANTLNNAQIGAQEVVFKYAGISDTVTINVIGVESLDLSKVAKVLTSTGDKLDGDVIVNFANGEKRVKDINKLYITWGYTISDGKRDVTVSYGGASAKMSVEYQLTQASSPEAYVLLGDGVLTFYYGVNPPDGHIDTICNVNNIRGWYDWKNYVKKAVFDKSFASYKPEIMYAWFANCKNMTEIVGMNDNLKTENVTDMGYLFNGCSSITSLDLSGFNTANVNYMWGMFNGCSRLKTIYIGDGWNMVNAYLWGDDMFSSCYKLYGSKGSSFNQYGASENYARIDGGADAPGYFTKAGDEPFYPTEAYAVLQDSTLTFFYAKNPPEGAYDIENGDLYSNNDWKTRVKKAVFDKSFAEYKPKSTYRWFNSCYNMTEIVGMDEYLNTENVFDMGYMFGGCSSLTSLDLSGFNTANVNYMPNFFSGCNKLRTIYVGDGWTMAALNKEQSWYTEDLFSYCYKLYGSKGSNVKDLGIIDTTYARIDGGVDAPGYFTKKGDNPYVPTEAYAILSDSTLTLYYGKNTFDNSLCLLDNNNPEWSNYYSQIKKAVFDKSFADYKPKSTNGWFYNCYNMTEIEGMKEYLNTELDTNMSYMFAYCNNIKDIDLSGFNTEKVTDMSNMFASCYNLTTLDVSSFNTKNVVNMYAMFSSCNKLTSIDVSGFNTENVRNMADMFAYCDNLTTLDLSNFDTKNVTYMYGVFSGCQKLETIYAGDGWNTSMLDNNNNVFRYCYKLVGGQGTMYNDTLTSCAYARLDGGKDKPGFFTKKGDKKPEVASIEITRLPTKLEYILGEYPLQLDSSLVSIKYDNGDAYTQTIAYTTVSGYNPVAAGKQTINVEFLGKSTSFEVEIVDKGVQPYTLFNTADSTLSIYYGNYKENAILGISTVDSLRYAVKTAIIDTSYKNFHPENTANMFSNYGSMTEIVGLENLNTEKDTTMAYMFAYCYNLSDIDLSHFNTENVKNMSSMFNTWGNSLTTLDLTSFNTAKVTSMYYMFTGNYNLTTIYVGDNWNTDSVTSAEYMYASCNKLVGGRGTQCYGNWDWNTNNNIRYAHIDGGSYYPGYFTQKSAAESVELEALPKKVEYLEGDAFDARGGKITVAYGDNATREINLSNASISGYDPNKVGKQTVTAEYEGKTFTFEVNVIAKSATAIALTTAPAKSEYVQGEEFAADGGVITVSFNNGTTSTVALDGEGVEMSGFDPNKVGEQPITVEYLGFTTVFSVTVSEKTPTSELAFDSDIRIWSFENTIYIENPGKEIIIVDMSGRVVKTINANADRMEIPMPKSGLYIVKTAKKSQKVTIK